VKIYGEVEVSKAFESSGISIEIKLGQEIMYAGVPKPATSKPEGKVVKVPFSFNLSEGQLWWPHNIG